MYTELQSGMRDDEGSRVFSSSRVI